MTRRALPPLNALRAFEAYARHGRLTVAAEELCVTHGAVSKQIKRLEQGLGTRLLAGPGALTPDGERLAGALHRLFDELELAMPRRPARAARRLVALCPGSFALKWLVPRLAGFAERCPDVELEVIDSSGPWRPAPDGPHVAVRMAGYEGVAGAEVEAAAFMERFHGPAISPAAFAACGGDPERMLRRPRLELRSLPREWSDWALATARAMPTPERALGFDRSFHMFEAATRGLGVCMGDWSVIQPELEDGRLVAPLGFVRSRRPLRLLWAKGDPNPDIRALLDWLTGEGAREAAPGSPPPQHPLHV